uniref:roadblock/LC7 domain-containing protein n=1 Tax=Tessaracoccus timonensis TaxID=2161816 RepID=UPI000D54FF6A|nr:roadblock/LC7 domain-containing protein [Tessaracoccus timonensis]
MTSNYIVSKTDELSRVIGNMRRSIPELHGVMIASTDGLPVAHDFSDSDAERIAAMAATALGLGGRIAERAELGDFAEAVVRGQNGYMVTYSAGTDAVLVLTGPIDSNLGLMRIEARVAAVELKQLLGRA